jgi:hypothetical protein
MTFDEAIFMFKKWDGDRWNFRYTKESDGSFTAWIMGEGSQQCLARKSGFKSDEEIKELFASFGVKNVLEGV